MSSGVPKRLCAPRRWLVRVTLLWAMCLASGAYAVQPARVVLVTSDPDASSTRRLEAELLDLGVEVEVVEPEDPSGPIGRAGLERLARRAGAFAAIRVVPIAAEVEVWVADRVTGKTVVREILRGSDESASFDDAIALGAVELLRASLLEVAATQRLHGDVPPPDVVQRMVPAPESPGRGSTEERSPEIHARERPPIQGRKSKLTARQNRRESVPSVRPSPVLKLTLEPAVDLGIGGLPRSIHGQILARAAVAGPFSGELLTAFPIAPAVIEDEQFGSAEFSSKWFALSALWNPAAGGFSPLLGIGLAAIRVEASGTATSAYASQREHVWVAAPILRAGLGLPLSKTFKMTADFCGAYALKGIPVRFADKQVAAWGRPAILVGAGIQVMLPLAAD